MLSIKKYNYFDLDIYFIKAWKKYKMKPIFMNKKNFHTTEAKLERKR